MGCWWWKGADDCDFVFVRINVVVQRKVEHTTGIVDCVRDNWGRDNNVAVGWVDHNDVTGGRGTCDENFGEDEKEDATKLVSITKAHQSPNKEYRIQQFIEDSIAMGLDTGDAKAMMIAELGNDV